MPQCMYCGTHLKTRKSLKRHCEALHHGRRVSEQHTPEKVYVNFFTNLFQQSLSCPLPYCSFTKFGCKNTKLLAKHFTSSHPYHELVIQHHCQTCNSYIDPAERCQHNRAHIVHSLRGTPLKDLVPHINEHDHSLEFAVPLSSSTINMTSPFDNIRLAPTPPYKLPGNITNSNPCSLSPSLSHAPTSVPTSHPRDESPPIPSTKTPSPASSPPSLNVNSPSQVLPISLDPPSDVASNVDEDDVISIGTGFPVPDNPIVPSPATNEVPSSVDVDTPTSLLHHDVTIVDHSQPLMEQFSQNVTPSTIDSNILLPSQLTPTLFDPPSREFMAPFMSGIINDSAPDCDKQSSNHGDSPNSADVEHECNGDADHDTRDVVISEERRNITAEINAKLARLRASLHSEEVDFTNSVGDLNAERGCMDSSHIPNNSLTQSSSMSSSRESDDFATAPPATRLRNIFNRDRTVSFATKLSETLRPGCVSEPARQNQTPDTESDWTNGDPWYDSSVLKSSTTGYPDANSDAVDSSSANEEDNDDSYIPSAQRRPSRPPDLVVPELVPQQSSTLNAADSDDGESFNDSQELPPQDNDLERLKAFRQKWLDIFSQDSSWEDFSKNCELFAAETASLASLLNKPPSARQNLGAPKPPPPPPRRPPNGRRIASFDPTAARRIQGLYRHSKKRAARKLLSDNAVSYSGSIEDAQTYFADVFSAKHANLNILQEALNDYVPTGKDHDLTKDLYTDMSESEIVAKLRSAANTSPGSDRCEYSHLKKIDPAAKILSVIFNRCQRQRDVPAPWKAALTILIYKKGADDDVSNFRPIALMSVIYKLFMGVIAKRLTRWAIDTGMLSAEQKSAQPSEGCFEHTFLLKSVVADARRRHKNLCLAWLDIRNAFGSVPHNTIQVTLQHMGVPSDLISLIMNAYQGATTVVRTPSGSTEPIPIEAGVKQGCPLSPILFNLCIELILRMVKNRASELDTGTCEYHGASISCLAYADDLVVLARSQRALQCLLDQASDGATILGFSFRPDKCASLSLSARRKLATITVVNDFLIQGSHIPALENEESYRYLGVPIGLIHNIDDIPNVVPRLIQDIEKIRASLLAPWQKLDAIRTFVQPCLTYALRAGNPLKQSLKLYRETLVKALREICNLPNRASSTYLFAHKKVGGLAFQDPTIESDLQAVVQAIRILSSPDEAVAKIAKVELKYIVRNMTQSNPTADLISKYLSSTPDSRLDHLRYSSHSSLWSRVRMACRRQHITFTYSDVNPPTISADGSDHIQSRNATFFLHRLSQQRYADSLMSLNDQGKVARCLTDDQYANGSTWHMTGLNIRFKDWRFIHRARLNCIPLNANKSRWSNTSPTCRHCTQPETLPHVICHCRPGMVQIRERHDKIVERVVNSIRFGTITTDRAVQESGLRLRPDIIVEEKNEVLIIDVACPFDNDEDALSNAALTKVNKYQGLKEHFQSTGRLCEVFPFVVGALGSWYKQNELLCKKLGMTRKYKSLFRKLCCTDAIQGSTNIYRLHLGMDDATPT